MKHDEYDDLIAAHFDGELSDEQAARLQRWLSNDPQNIRRYLLAAHLHGDLHDQARGAKLSSLSSPIVPFRMQTLVRYLVPIAASLLCLVVGYFWWHRSQGQPYLAFAEGQVVLLRGEKSLELKPDLPLQNGDRLRVGRESVTTIGYRGETTEVNLDAETELVLATSDIGAKRIELKSGGIRAGVAPQPKGKPMLVQTPTAEAVVLGTRFEIAVNRDKTHLQVEHGKVSIAKTAAPKHSQLVSRYYSADVGEDEIRVEPAPMYLSSLIEDGLLAYWPMDEGEGKILHDHSGNGYRGTIEGAMWRSGYRNSGLAFRTRTSHVETESITMPSSFSIASWARVDEQAERGQPVLSNTSEEGIADGFRLMINITKGGEPRAVFYSSDGRAEARATSFPGLLSASKWHHVVAVVDQVNGHATMYIDGKQASNATPIVANFKASGRLRIGQFGHGVTGPPDRALDELRIYTRSLSIEEIQLLADRGNDKIASRNSAL